ncbi:MAG: F-type H+-transporting ATPase subunit b [Thermoanaerobacteraceae bacterium]|jgi:F-type H+-transporting ATPase subunit b|uniref:ATP synthase subunit b n=1 Tax=Biomaibacter acetigenes TaxID=2316383 RepID=A0A3G2R8M1_9FIRM|nr:F0F1 ATP synthase subunit B [Biomaibacter acetigenes]AYO31786.1 ATP synthase F0 subunit B [Biomaibacter acetigenes]MDK2878698.1 F-type H+-transporting ATPase subunit b [Thermoanaerobacteraceae bacterium]MDN5313661.1 F-type H+-transporting ATPase subunit b [Thermoanaerobacteraceae bacterium]RKL62470.1 ATP synthase F0 subunit B [Thermoanaerobacteraceae bacterium SP2]
MLVNVYTMIFQLINVFILFYFLKRFLYKPLGDFLKKRREDLKSLFDEAERRKIEAEGLYKEYQAKIKNAHAEVRSIIEQAKQEAAALRQELIQKAKQEAESMTAQARGEIERQKSKAVSEVMEKAAELSVMIASKILEEKLSPEDHRKLIHRVIERMDERQWLQ